jgi:hypothetical protein
LPIARLSQLAFDKLSDEQLVLVYRRVSYSAARLALRLAALEAAGRDGLGGALGKPQVYDVLVSVARNSSEALEFNKQGRAAAVAAGQSPAHWLIQELEIRLGRGEQAVAQALVDQIRTDHMNDPVAQQELYQLMVRCGAVSLDKVMAQRGQRAAQQQRVAAGPAPPAPGKLWTPDSPAPTPAPVGEEPPEKKPLIWTPDQGEP